MSNQAEMSQPPPGFSQMESIPVADDTNGSDVEFIGAEPSNIVRNLNLYYYLSFLLCKVLI